MIASHEQSSFKNNIAPDGTLSLAFCSADPRQLGGLQVPKLVLGESPGSLPLQLLLFVITLLRSIIHHGSLARYRYLISWRNPVNLHATVNAQLLISPELQNHTLIREGCLEFYNLSEIS